MTWQCCVVVHCGRDVTRRSIVPPVTPPRTRDEVRALLQSHDLRLQTMPFDFAVSCAAVCDGEAQQLTSNGSVARFFAAVATAAAAAAAAARQKQPQEQQQPPAPVVVFDVTVHGDATAHANDAHQLLRTSSYVDEDLVTLLLCPCSSSSNDNNNNDDDKDRRGTDKASSEERAVVQKMFVIPSSGVVGALQRAVRDTLAAAAAAAAGTPHATSVDKVQRPRGSGNDVVSSGDVAVFAVDATTRQRIALTRDADARALLTRHARSNTPCWIMYTLTPPPAAAAAATTTTTATTATRDVAGRGATTTAAAARRLSTQTTTTTAAAVPANTAAPLPPRADAHRRSVTVDDANAQLTTASPPSPRAAHTPELQLARTHTSSTMMSDADDVSDATPMAPAAARHPRPPPPPPSSHAHRGCLTVRVVLVHQDEDDRAAHGGHDGGVGVARGHAAAAAAAEAQVDFVYTRGEATVLQRLRDVCVQLARQEQQQQQYTQQQQQTSQSAATAVAEDVTLHAAKARIAVVVGHDTHELSRDADALEWLALAREACRPLRVCVLPPPPPPLSSSPLPRCGNEAAAAPTTTTAATAATTATTRSRAASPPRAGDGNGSGSKSGGGASRTPAHMRVAALTEALQHMRTTSTAAAAATAAAHTPPASTARPRGDDVAQHNGGGGAALRAPRTTSIAAVTPATANTNTTTATRTTSATTSPTRKERSAATTITTTSVLHSPLCRCSEAATHAGAGGRSRPSNKAVAPRNGSRDDGARTTTATATTGADATTTAAMGAAGAAHTTARRRSSNVSPLTTTSTLSLPRTLTQHSIAAVVTSLRSASDDASSDEDDNGKKDSGGSSDAMACAVHDVQRLSSLPPHNNNNNNNNNNNKQDKKNDDKTNSKDKTSRRNADNNNDDNNGSSERESVRHGNASQPPQQATATTRTTSSSASMTPPVTPTASLRSQHTTLDAVAAFSATEVQLPGAHHRSGSVTSTHASVTEDNRSNASAEAHSVTSRPTTSLRRLTAALLSPSASWTPRKRNAAVAAAAATTTSARSNSTSSVHLGSRGHRVVSPTASMSAGGGGGGAVQPMTATEVSPRAPSRRGTQKTPQQQRQQQQQQQQQEDVKMRCEGDAQRPRVNDSRRHGEGGDGSTTDASDDGSSRRSSTRHGDDGDDDDGSSSRYSSSSVSSSDSDSCSSSCSSCSSCSNSNAHSTPDALLQTCAARTTEPPALLAYDADTLYVQVFVHWHAHHALVAASVSRCHPLQSMQRAIEDEFAQVAQRRQRHAASEEDATRGGRCVPAVTTTVPTAARAATSSPLRMHIRLASDDAAIASDASLLRWLQRVPLSAAVLHVVSDQHTRHDDKDDGDKDHYCNGGRRDVGGAVAAASSSSPSAAVRTRTTPPQQHDEQQQQQQQEQLRLRASLQRVAVELMSQLPRHAHASEVRSVLLQRLPCEHYTQHIAGAAAFFACLRDGVDDGQTSNDAATTSSWLTLSSTTSPSSSSSTTSPSRAANVAAVVAVLQRCVDAQQAWLRRAARCAPAERQPSQPPQQQPPPRCPLPASSPPSPAHAAHTQQGKDVGDEAALCTDACCRVLDTCAACIRFANTRQPERAVRRFFAAVYDALVVDVQTTAAAAAAATSTTTTQAAMRSVPPRHGAQRQHAHTTHTNSDIRRVDGDGDGDDATPAAASAAAAAQPAVMAGLELTRVQVLQRLRDLATLGETLWRVSGTLTRDAFARAMAEHFRGEATRLRQCVAAARAHGRLHMHCLYAYTDSERDTLRGLLREQVQHVLAACTASECETLVQLSQRTTAVDGEARRWLLVLLDMVGCLLAARRVRCRCRGTDEACEAAPAATKVAAAAAADDDEDDEDDKQTRRRRRQQRGCPRHSHSEHVSGEGGCCSCCCCCCSDEGDGGGGGRGRRHGTGVRWLVRHFRGSVAHVLLARMRAHTRARALPQHTLYRACWSVLELGLHMGQLVQSTTATAQALCQWVFAVLQLECVARNTTFPPMPLHHEGVVVSDEVTPAAMPAAAAAASTSPLRTEVTRRTLPSPPPQSPSPPSLLSPSLLQHTAQAPPDKHAPPQQRSLSAVCTADEQRGDVTGNTQSGRRVSDARAARNTPAMATTLAQPSSSPAAAAATAAATAAAQQDGSGDRGAGARDIAATGSDVTNKKRVVYRFMYRCNDLRTPRMYNTAARGGTGSSAGDSTTTNASALSLPSHATSQPLHTPRSDVVDS